MAMLNELLDNLEDRDQLGDVDALFEPAGDRAAAAEFGVVRVGGKDENALGVDHVILR